MEDDKPQNYNNNFVDINNRTSDNPAPSSSGVYQNNQNDQNNPYQNAYSPPQQPQNQYNAPQQNNYPPQQPPQGQGYNYQPNNPIIINSQAQPQAVVYVNPSLYKTNPVATQCSSCRNSGLSRVVSEFDCSNYCCYFCFGPVIWIIYQAARDKDISCMNADHFCSFCGYRLYSYKAC